MNDKKYAVCFDSQSCLKCFSCAVNCSVENRARLHREGVKNTERSANDPMLHYGYLTPVVTERGVFPETVSIAALKHCMHCENPQCVEICPTGAIQKRESGAVVPDQSKCVGCRACADACPFDVPVFSPDTGRSFKCVRCYDRTEAGMPTACAEACPSVAMFSGQEEEVIAEARKRAAKYEEVYNKRYVVYGADPVDGTVGTLGFLTVAPLENAEDYLLPEEPKGAVSAARKIVKIAAVAGIAATAGAVAAHAFHWRSKKNGSVYDHKDGE